LEVKKQSYLDGKQRGKYKVLSSVCQRKEKCQHHMALKISIRKLGNLL
jgi:hypothetical protein